MTNQQLIISGVGGQGILFITRLLADAAIASGRPVLTSETHGMAQRGGVVISHLKAGDFSSPLVRPGQADGLICLKEENLALHRSFLRPGGWTVVNAAKAPAEPGTYAVDADRLALALGNPQGVNLIVLGFLVAHAADLSLFCSAGDVAGVLQMKLGTKGDLFARARAALEAGSAAAATAAPALHQEGPLSPC